MTDRLPLAATASAATAIALSVNQLGEDELTVLQVMGLLSHGKVYKVWVNLDQILARLDSEKSRDHRLRTLANMKSRGIMEEGAGKWRAVWWAADRERQNWLTAASVYGWLRWVRSTSALRRPWQRGAADRLRTRYADS